MWCIWRPTSSGNCDVLICINALFLTQRVLKQWWSWTYQNSAVKCASAIVVPRWVTSWEVWFRGAKSGQYCVVWSGSLQCKNFLLVIFYQWNTHIFRSKKLSDAMHACTTGTQRIYRFSLFWMEWINFIVKI
jgi:hypothetical protein